MAKLFLDILFQETHKLTGGFLIIPSVTLESPVAQIERITPMNPAVTFKATSVFLSSVSVIVLCCSQCVIHCSCNISIY